MPRVCSRRLLKRNCSFISPCTLSDPKKEKLEKLCGNINNERNVAEIFGNYSKTLVQLLSLFHLSASANTSFASLKFQLNCILRGSFNGIHLKHYVVYYMRLVSSLQLIIHLCMPFVLTKRKSLPFYVPANLCFSKIFAFNLGKHCSRSRSAARRDGGASEMKMFTPKKHFCWIKI